MEDQFDKEFLLRRIAELEEKVRHLRFSRRILMNLLERLEQERGGLVQKLQKENKKLQSSNTKYAQSILWKNRRILELEKKSNGEIQKD